MQYHSTNLFYQHHPSTHPCVLPFVLDFVLDFDLEFDLYHAYDLVRLLVLVAVGKDV
jgi:hypothetical protein